MSVLIPMDTSLPVQGTSVAAIRVRVIALFEAVKHCAEVAAAGRVETEACGNDNYDQLQARI